MTEKLEKIIIAGGGTAGWMSAASLSKHLKKGCEIILIESDSIGTIGVGEATIPVIRGFNDSLGIDEREFVKNTQGSFKLGIEFANWGNIGETYFHPFGTHGRNIDAVAVHQHWLKNRDNPQIKSFDNYAMAWQMAKQQKFALPHADKRSVLSTFSYAYHFDAGLYAKYLRKYSEALGVKRVEGKINQVNQDPETGFVTSLTLENGQTHSADLFLDCTGFRALLIEGALGEEFIDWSKWLMNDRAVTVASSRLDPLPSHTVSTAHSAGWQWRIPLQHRTGNGHVYCSKFMEAEEAEKILVDNIETPPYGHIRVI